MKALKIQNYFQKLKTFPKFSEQFINRKEIFQRFSDNIAVRKKGKEHSRKSPSNLWETRRGKMPMRFIK